MIMTTDIGGMSTHSIYSDNVRGRQKAANPLLRSHEFTTRLAISSSLYTIHLEQSLWLAKEWKVQNGLINTKSDFKHWEQGRCQNYNENLSYDLQPPFTRGASFIRIHQIAKFMGPNGAHLGPVRPIWAPCRPHEPCYQGSHLLDWRAYCSIIYFHSNIDILAYQYIKYKVTLMSHMV